MAGRCWPEVTAVRDSKDRRSSITFGRDAWSSFISAVRNGGVPTDS
ncbi:DUF397 domain-containing protein [Streptomyces sp. NPDC051162]